MSLSSRPPPPPFIWAPRAGPTRHTAGRVKWLKAVLCRPRATGSHPLKGTQSQGEGVGKRDGAHWCERALSERGPAAGLPFGAVRAHGGARHHHLSKPGGGGGGGGWGCRIQGLGPAAPPPPGVRARSPASGKCCGRPRRSMSFGEVSDPIAWAHHLKAWAQQDLRH